MDCAIGPQNTPGDLVLLLTPAACLQSATRIKELESLTTMLRSQLQASSTSAKDVLETAVQILAEGAALSADQARLHICRRLSAVHVIVCMRSHWLDNSFQSCM